MKNKNVKAYLNNYIELSNPKYAVLLKGSWGCGKTHFIKQLLKEWNVNKDSDKDGIVLKPVYISLNGVVKTNTVTKLIKEELNPLLYSKSSKVALEILKGLAKATVKVDVDSLISDVEKDDYSVSLEINPFSLLSSGDPKIKGNKVLIFDDIERCKIDLEELFGYINNFVEHQACKVILIGDEDKFKEPKNDIKEVQYKHFKEKLIGQTFSIENDLDEAIKHFIEDTSINSNPTHSKSLLDNLEIIKEVFIYSEINNLRILRQSILDINRFVDLLTLKEDYKKSKKYPQYIKSVIVYFLLAYFEYKSGNTDIENYSEYTFNGSNNLVQSESKKKYEQLIVTQNVDNTFKNFVSIGVEYIKSGTILADKTEQIESQSKSYFDIKKDTAFDKLQHLPHINNEEFCQSYNEVHKEYFNDKLTTVDQVIQYYNTFNYILSLGINTDKTRTKEEYEHKAKEYIDKFIPLGSLSHKEKATYLYLQPAQYFQEGRENEVTKYVKSKIEKCHGVMYQNHIEELFYNLTDDNVIKLNTHLKTTEIPDGTDLYFYTSILKGLNPEKLSESIMNLSGYGKNMFKYFLENRQETSGLEKVLTDEIGTIKSLKSELEKKVVSLKLLEEYFTRELIAAIDKIIDNNKTNTQSI